MSSFKWPLLGCGVGLRSEHYQTVLEDKPKVDWFEAITENYMDSGGKPLHVLEEVRAHYPIGLHGVSLSVGSADPLNRRYLHRLKKLIRRIEPAIVSDHLCWTGVREKQLYDLLPLPFTEEAVKYISRRIDEIQTHLCRKILIENVSSYVTYKHSTLPEWEFLSEVAKRSGCGILLDLNNVYVNSKNHGFDASEYVRSIPAAYVGQYHLAGHTERGDFLFDTHNRPVIEEVWNLYQEALACHGPVTALIEWDADLPPFQELAKEAEKARVYYEKAKKETSISVETATAQTNKIKSQDFIGGNAPGLKKYEEAMLAYIAPYENQITGEKIGDDLLPQTENQSERLAVYREGYLVRCEEALAEAFEGVQSVLGRERFQILVHNYARNYPLKSSNLNDAGIYFSKFLKVWPGVRAWPFLADLADLEWKVMRAFHAFEKAPLASAFLSKMSLEEFAMSKIYFQPSVQIAASVWPILNYWRERKKENKFEDFRQASPQRVLIFRRGVEVFCELIDETQYAVLTALQNQKTIMEVLEELSSILSDPEDLTRMFGGWVQKGLITGCKIQTPPLSFSGAG